MRTLPLTLCMCAMATALAGPGRAADRPNIVYIMSDDHAAHAIGAYGSHVNQTPNIDRLAREGAVLTNVFATNSICTPSRATILTGQYSHINGVTMFNRFDSSRMTVARLLQAGGYYTGMIGKWHLGSDPAGFDHWEILPGQGVYTDPVFYTANDEKTYAGRYVTDVITELGIDFIRNRPKDKPFFLMLHHKAPHRPWEPDAAHGARFAGQWIPEPETFWDSYDTRTDALHENQQRVAKDLTRRDLKLVPPADLSGSARAAWLATKPESVTTEIDGKTVTLTGEALVRWKYQRYMQDYLATVQSVDDSVGKVLEFLDRSGLSKNTIVIYTSDQGFFLGDHGLFDKRFMYEDSLRMPLLVRYPRAIKPGAVNDDFVLNLDFPETLLDYAGASIPADMQGRSLRPLLEGHTPPDWRTSMYYRYWMHRAHFDIPAHYGIRTKEYKLIYYYGQACGMKGAIDKPTQPEWELFDLREDPLELNNVYAVAAYQPQVKQLKQQLNQLRKEYGDNSACGAF
jgi:arylsulfatase A-like enzyme